MVLSFKERRRFVRHPICYPLEFEYAPRKIIERSRTVDVSEGGLLFLSKRNLQSGKTIILKMPLQNRLFRVKAKVVHVQQDRENPKLYNIGVSFYRHSDAFEVKLVEQIYLMDEYRALRAIQLGREVSFKEASLEWVRKYAKKFDDLFWGQDQRQPQKPSH
ncbi:MAG: PilZ domain-containing protein [Candidatus Omnitrophota bacterium]